MKERLQQTDGYQGGRVRGRRGKDDLDGVPAVDACALKAETGKAQASGVPAGHGWSASGSRKRWVGRPRMCERR